MKLVDLFISEDRRRKRVRPTLLSWIMMGVGGMLALGMLAFSIQRIWAGGAMEPIATEIPETEAAVEATSPPEPTPQEGCPKDPSQWGLREYTFPLADGKEQILYAIEPQCVMEMVEEDFAEAIDARAEHGRNWTMELEDRYTSYEGFTGILSGEEHPDLKPEWRKPMCFEAWHEDGVTPYTSEDYHIAFYTASEDGTVVDLLVVADQLGIAQVYDCETGELKETKEPTGNATVSYQPMLYDEDAGRWKKAYHYDVVEYIPLDQVDGEALTGLILEAQGRR